MFLKIRKILNNDLDRVIPGHEPKLFERHVSWQTESGNCVAEVNLGAGEGPRRPSEFQALASATS
ncbi:hypothetical protein [Pseudodonghicola xiamenensis]|uniref:Uncharacterized protein n=1 Tax=Pseudodonghicola xiamenensis TaxID=337702 RepID=A0A8J3HAZ3_9RHOB|nr:hypothetical protein [Pseudodonghicola xiamenensis]GHG97045.1 hypothetical protein GCM10010961_31610 [Pseudodonghicola xiamenensis]